MKKILLLSFATLCFSFANNIQAQQKEKWKELDAFHEVMSKTFHPAEEGKLERGDVPGGESRLRQSVELDRRVQAHLPVV